ncbi:MAG: hypothetical protein ABIN67_12250 [Ferruginibacter sp.]
MTIQDIVLLAEYEASKTSSNIKRKKPLHNRFSYISTMKAKHTIIILGLGYCLDFLGTLFKITHAPKADLVLTIAAMLKVFGLLLVLYKLISYSKLKDFLNS